MPKRPHETYRRAHERQWIKDLRWSGLGFMPLKPGNVLYAVGTMLLEAVLIAKCSAILILGYMKSSR